MNDKFLPPLTGFRIQKESQYSTLFIHNAWKMGKKLGKGRFIGVVFMDFPKVFHSVNHNLLVT